MTIARRLAPLARAHGSRRARRADVARELGVGARLAVGDAPQGVPDAPLEGAAGVLEREVEGAPAPGEVLVQLRAQACEQRAVAGGERAAEAPAQRVELRLHHPPVGVLEQAQRPVGRAGDERADRRLQPGQADEGAVGRRRRFAGRRPRQLAERRPEAGVGAPAVVEHHLVDRVAGAQRDERVAEPARPAVGLERHAVRLLEPAAHGRRVEALGAQAGVRDARRGVGLDAPDEPRRPLGRAGLRVERPAPLAGAKARHQRLARRRVELDVLGLRAARRARRAAEDAGGGHRGVEQPVVGPVALAQRGEHLLAREHHGGAIGPADL